LKEFTCTLDTEEKLRKMIDELSIHAHSVAMDFPGATGFTKSFIYLPYDEDIVHVAGLWGWQIDEDGKRINISNPEGTIQIQLKKS